MQFVLNATSDKIEQYAILFPKYEHREWDAVLETKDWMGGYGDLVSKLPDSKFRPEGGVSLGVGHRLFYDAHYDVWIVEIDTLDELLMMSDRCGHDFIVAGFDDVTGLRRIRVYDDYE